jgi:hypothetical protein
MYSLALDRFNLTWFWLKFLDESENTNYLAGPFSLELDRVHDSMLRRSGKLLVLINQAKNRRCFPLVLASRGVCRNCSQTNL